MHTVIIINCCTYGITSYHLTIYILIIMLLMYRYNLYLDIGNQYYSRFRYTLMLI